MWSPRVGKVVRAGGGYTRKAVPAAAFDPEPLRVASSGFGGVWQFAPPRELPEMTPAEQLRWGLDYMRARGYLDPPPWETYGGDWGPALEPVRVASLAEFEAEFGPRPDYNGLSAGMTIFDEYAAWKRPPWWARAIAWGIAIFYGVRRG